MVRLWAADWSRSAVIAYPRDRLFASGKSFVQMYISALRHKIYGRFAGVNLIGGGQRHCALLGRTFLRNFTMVYEGRTGTVRIGG